MNRWSKLLFALCVCSGAPAFAGEGWTHEASPTATVHGHVFNKVRAEGNGCELALRFWFDAPRSGYEDERNAVRNHYRFVAQVGFQDGRKVRTKMFANRGPGRRLFATTIDTTAAGCWTKTPSKIVKLDVNGCRGASCGVDPLP